jgi:hypothetical protein
MTTPIYMPPPVEDEKPSRGYLNPMEGMSGIGRAMRDKYMAQQAADSMMQRPITPPRPDGEEPLQRYPRPPDEVYKKGGSVKRKSDMSHRSNADHVKKHYAVGGFMHHSDHAKKLCGGGYMKGKK